MLAKKRSLSLFIIDDNRLSQLMLMELITNSLLYRVEGFDSVEDCLEGAQAEPKIILLDYSLPGINGLEAIPRLKARWPKAQIIMVSAQQNLDIVKKILKADIAYYVDKSEDLEQELLKGMAQAEKIALQYKID